MMDPATARLLIDLAHELQGLSVRFQALGAKVEKALREAQEAQLLAPACDCGRPESGDDEDHPRLSAQDERDADR